MKHTITKNLTLSALFLALGLVLPFVTGQIPQIGNLLLPMHIPVLLCGLICGWQYGGAVGFVLPLLRSVWLGAPPMVLAIPMAFELAGYGALAGAFYGKSRWKCVKALYRCLIAAMIGGRLIWGVAKWAMMGLTGGTFTLELFLSGALLSAIPGIVLQLILIPAIMVALDKAKLVPFTKRKKSVACRFTSFLRQRLLDRNIPE